MDSIRIDNGIKKIEVNDKGECIQYCITDRRFFEGFFDLAKWFEEQQSAVDAMQLKKRQEQFIESKSGSDTDIVKEILDIRSRIGKAAGEKINAIFGADTCMKVFSTNEPDMFSVLEFFDAIQPIIEKHATERHQKISTKYNQGRNGANS